jgi:hypothetical protein
MSSIEIGVGRVDSNNEPHSTQNPHQSAFLNLLDPRVDQKALKNVGKEFSGLMK